MNGTEKRELAVRNKHNGMNCCQAVIAVYAEELGIDIETAKNSARHSEWEWAT